MVKIISLKSIGKYFSLGIIISSVFHFNVAAVSEQLDGTGQSYANFGWITNRTAC